MQTTSATYSNPTGAYFGVPRTSTTAKSASNAASENNGNSVVGSQQSDSADDVEQTFLKWARMTPLERMRAQILKGMGLTEESLKSMPPDKRQEIENKIRQMIEQQLKDKKGAAGKATGQLVDVAA